jgi:hypothetical protein
MGRFCRCNPPKAGQLASLILASKINSFSTILRVSYVSFRPTIVFKGFRNKINYKSEDM